MDDALEWLKESLSDAIEDFFDGNNEGIPLVPVMDYAETAMENSEFQQILKAFGICEPFDEQEAYWRIPSDLSISTLKDSCSLIQQALEKTLVITDTSEDRAIKGNEPEIATNDDSSDDDIFEKLRVSSKKSIARQQIVESEASIPQSEDRAIKGNEPEIATNDDSSDDDIFEKLRVSSKKSIARQQIVESEASIPQSELVSLINPENSDDNYHGLAAQGNGDEPDTHLNSSINTSKRRVIIDSDSDDNARLEDSKRDRSMSISDSEKPVSKRPRVLDSDDSE